MLKTARVTETARGTTAAAPGEVRQHAGGGAHARRIVTSLGPDRRFLKYYFRPHVPSGYAHREMSRSGTASGVVDREILDRQRE